MKFLRHNSAQFKIPGFRGEPKFSGTIFQTAGNIGIASGHNQILGHEDARAKSMVYDIGIAIIVFVSGQWHLIAGVLRNNFRVLHTERPVDKDAGTAAAIKVYKTIAITVVGTADAAPKCRLGIDRCSILHEHTGFAEYRPIDLRGDVDSLHSRIVGAAVHFRAVDGQVLAPKGGLAAVYGKSVGAGDRDVALRRVNAKQILLV